MEKTIFNVYEPKPFHTTKIKADVFYHLQLETRADYYSHRVNYWDFPATNPVMPAYTMGTHFFTIKNTENLSYEQVAYLNKTHNGRTIKAPYDYIYTKKETRKELLAGILDSYAKYDKKNNSFVIPIQNTLLSASLKYVCTSLNIKLTVGNSRMVITGNYDSIPMRTHDINYVEQELNLPDTYRLITISKKKLADYYKITVDGDQRFLYADGTIAYDDTKKF